MGYWLSSSTSPFSFEIFKISASIQISSAMDSQQNPQAQRRLLNAKGLEPGKLCERQPNSCQEWDMIPYPCPTVGPPTSSHFHPPFTPSPMGHRFLPEKAIRSFSLRIFLPDQLLKCRGRMLALLRRVALAQHSPSQASSWMLSICHSFTANCHT